MESASQPMPLAMPQATQAQPTNAIECPLDAIQTPANAPESELHNQPAKPWCIKDVAIPFTSEQASAASKKRWELFHAAKTPQPPQNASNGKETAVASNLKDKERLALVREYKALAAASRKQLMTLTDPKDRHQEASTLAKLEACYWRYAGIPGEGTLKPQAPTKDKRKPFNMQVE